MLQWDIWLVKQKYARGSLIPPQPNDPSDYNRMYLIVADPNGRPTAICCPIQNSASGVRLTEVPLLRGYTSCITKNSKVVCHDIFTLPNEFFEKKVGFIRSPEQDHVQTALVLVFDLN